MLAMMRSTYRASRKLCRSNHGARVSFFVSRLETRAHASVHAAKQILDNFGSDGWELVQIVPGMNPENLVGYFKRPLA